MHADFGLIPDLPFPVFQKDENGRFVNVNQAFCEFLGRDLSEIIDFTDHEIFPPLLADEFRKDDERIMTEFRTNSKNLTIDKPEIIRCREKTWRIRTLKCCALDKNGNLIGVHGAFYLYEKEWETQSLWSIMLERSNDIVYAHAESGEILLLNSKGREACGLKPNEEIPKTLTFFDWIPRGKTHPKRIETFKAILKQEFKASSHRPQRLIHLKLNKVVRLLQISVQKVENTTLAGGTIILGVANDITEKRILERQKHESERLRIQEKNLALSLSAFDQAIRDINHFMSHEFKNPLTSGITALKILKDDCSKFESENSVALAVRESIENAHRNLEKGLSDINEFQLE